MTNQIDEANNNINKDDDYVLTLYEVCELLGKSTRTLTRYVQRRVLHPRAIKSCQGTLEYRFSRAEVYGLRENEKRMRPYLFMSGDQNAAAPNYAQASFANYAALAQPQQTPFLVPGVAFPMSPNQYAPQANPQMNPPAWPAAMSPINSRINPLPQNNAPASAGGGNDAAEFAREMEAFERKKYRQKRIEEKEAEERSAGKNFEKTKKQEPEKETISRIKETQDRANEQMISLLKETTEMLRGQLKTKDDQIKNLDDKIGQLIERNRETNILLKGLQDKIMLLEKPKEEKSNDRFNPSEKEKPLADQAEIVKNDFVQEEKKNIFEDKKTSPAAAKETKDLESEDGCGLPLPPVKTSAVDEKEKRRRKNEKKGLFGKIFG